MYYSQALSVLVVLATTLPFAMPQESNAADEYFFECKDGLDIMPENCTISINKFTTIEIGGFNLSNSYMLVNVTGPDLKPGDYTIERWEAELKPLNSTQKLDVLIEEARRLNETIWPLLDTSDCVSPNNTTLKTVRKRANRQPPLDPNDPQRQVITEEQIERLRAEAEERNRVQRLRVVFLAGLFVLAFPVAFQPALNSLVPDNIIAQGLIAWLISGIINVLSGAWRDILNFLRDVRTRLRDIDFREVLAYTNAMRVSGP